MSEVKHTSPCCDAEVKLDKKKGLFVCQKDQTEIEPHFLIRSDHSAEWKKELKAAFQRVQDEQ